MKDITELPQDLLDNFKKNIQEAKLKTAHRALAVASAIAPKDTGFLSTQGAAYADGALVATTPQTVTPTNGQQRHSFAPEIQAEGVTVEFVAKRASKKRTFDYALYVGKFDPEYLKNPKTQHWIEQSLSPERVRSYIKGIFSND